MLHIIDSIDKDNSRIVEFVAEDVESINIRLKLGAPVTSEYVDGIMYYHRVQKEKQRKPFTNPTISGVDENDIRYLIILLENKGFIRKGKDNKIVDFKTISRRLDDAKLSVPIEDSTEVCRVPMEQLAHTVNLFAKRGLLRKSPVDFDDHINFIALEEKLNQARLVVENPSLSMCPNDKFLSIGFDKWNKIFCTCYAQALLDSDGNINIDEICRRLKQG